MGAKQDIDLHQLAVLAGIQPEATLKTKKTILKGLGYQVDTEKQVAASLAQKEDQLFLQGMNPTVVTRRNRQHFVDVAVKAGHGQESINWAVDGEGQERKGGTKVDDLRLMSTREINGETYELRRLELPEDLPLGYMGLSVKAPGDERTLKARLISAPQKCHEPIDFAGGEKTWGVPAQLYATRSDTDQGIGDFTDLAKLGDIVGRAGGGILGSSPLHAMFPENPEEASPYAPSSRTFTNHIYLDVTAVPEFKRSEKAQAAFNAPEFQERMNKVRRKSHIDYTAVMELKNEILQHNFDAFNEDYANIDDPVYMNNLPEERRDRLTAYADFVKEGGDSMHRFASFQALSEYMTAQTPRPQTWHDWPEEYHHPDSSAVKAFEKEHKDRVDFFKFMQFECDCQMAEVARACKDAGMKVGLYTDMAVGVDANSAEAWAEPDLYATNLTSGAPADVLSTNGQDWMLIAHKPEELQRRGYEPVIQMMRSAMKHSGSMRIDHVLQLARLHLKEAGDSPKNGGFLHYPVDDLMAIVALESHRNECMVIGEDLGQLPYGFREKMEDHGLFSYRVMPFERDYSNGEAFNHPSSYPKYAVAAPSTHDTPPLADQWRSNHVHLKDFIGYYDNDAQRDNDFERDANGRVKLNEALTNHGSWERVGGKPVENPREATDAVPEKLEQAVADYLGSSETGVVLMPMSDIFRANFMGNVPATVQRATSDHPDANKRYEKGASELPYPNWRPKEPFQIEVLEEHPVFKDMANIFNNYRPHGNEKGIQREAEPYQSKGHTPRKKLDPQRALRIYKSLADKGIFKKYAHESLKARFSAIHKQVAIEAEADRKKKYYESRREFYRQKAGHNFTMTEKGSSQNPGANVTKDGVQFSLFSKNATKVELCLFDKDGNETQRLAMPKKDKNGMWTGMVPGMKEGQQYGYRVHGPYDPKNGHRFNPNKLLMDPYAKELKGELQHRDEIYGYTKGHPDGNLSFDERDSAPFVPKSVVVKPKKGKDVTGEKPQTPWEKTTIYEAHVKGLTKLHPDVPEDEKGTYAALQNPEVLKHVKSVASTVELLPVQMSEQVKPSGLDNYWKYDPLNYFALDPSYASDKEDTIGEFQKTVKTMHAEGLEVVMDVVGNHTGEGDADGPTVSFRGLDNASYYLHKQGENGELELDGDATGCGNTLNMNEPAVRKMFVDSLRHSAETLGVDGFRFDLASTLVRDENGNFDQNHPFFKDVENDPVLSKVKLISEPWDLKGYNVGDFPKEYRDWNDKFRDDTRRFWSGQYGMACAMAERVCGSDVMLEKEEGKTASVNFITAHDGFTLHDLVSYKEKHNEANLEDSRDGSNNNHCDNCGVEGETNIPNIKAYRAKRERNMLSTLFLARGTPMLTAGDEMSRTQGGNNNAYCQDNEISWVNWESEKENLPFVQKLKKLRDEHPAIGSTKLFNGQKVPGTAHKDITWLRPDSKELENQDWSNAGSRALAYMVSGDSVKDENGGKPDDDFIVIMNAHDGEITWNLPKAPGGGKWEMVVDTVGIQEEMTRAAPVKEGSKKLKVQKQDEKTKYGPKKPYIVEKHSVVVLKAKREKDTSSSNLLGRRFSLDRLKGGKS